MSFKKIILSFLFIITGFITFAQEKDITGSWELKKAKYGPQKIMEIPEGLYKIFKSDGTFANMRLTADGYVKSHEGQFKLSDNNTYIETVKISTNTVGVSKKQTSLTYNLSEDGNILSLKGTLILEDGITKLDFFEEWKKIVLEP